MTLESIANIPGSPSFIALKKTCARELWTKQREEYRIRNTPAVYQDSQAIAAADQVNRLVDIAEMITRHSGLAKDLQSKGREWLQQSLVESFKPQDAIAMIRLGAELERLCAGMATEAVDLQNSDRSLEPAKIVRVVIDPQNGRTHNSDS